MAGIQQSQLRSRTWDTPCWQSKRMMDRGNTLTLIGFAQTRPGLRRNFRGPSNKTSICDAIPRSYRILS